MSDFIYSSTPRKEGEIGGHLQAIYHADAPEVCEYHGTWGSLAVTRSQYQGFQPLETEKRIFIVIGGPVLYFTDNRFLTGDDPHAGTRSVLERFEEGALQWDVDLSGPFVILSIDKQHKTVTCITDLMLFIPVYQFFVKGELVLGTHVDAVARAAHQQQKFDPVSLADFIINHSVTFPYTTYEKLRQLHPAALHRFVHQDLSERIRKDSATETRDKKAEQNGVFAYEPEFYWLPDVYESYRSIRDAALDLRVGILNYIHRVTEGMDEVAQFISAGVDSRVIAGMLPENLKRVGYVFLDQMNREGRLAAKASRAYGLQFEPQYRSKTHYLDILHEASDLIGSGSQHIHAHSLGFHKTCRLDRYAAVFGGYSADVFLKGYYQVRKKDLGNPAGMVASEEKNKTVEKRDIRWHMNESIRCEVANRRKLHGLYVQKFRPGDYSEWAQFWPSSIRVALPNLSTNRRLFRTYEPFLCNDIVKLCAAAPVKWKRKNRLYHKAMHPYLKKSRWLIHQEGSLPYYPWWINALPLSMLSVWRIRKKIRKPSPATAHEGPWGNWKTTMDTPEWKAWIKLCESDHAMLQSLFTEPPGKLVSDLNLHRKQVVNLFQVIIHLKDGKIPDKQPIKRELRHSNLQNRDLTV